MKVYTLGMSIVAISETRHRIGLKELRANLSDYIDAVKAGRTYTVTEHGTPVAQLSPMDGQSAYERLLAQGVIQLALRRPGVIEPPIAGSGFVSDLVAEQRR